MDQKAPLLQSTLLVPQLQLLFFPFSFSSLEFPLLPQLFPLLQNTENISITNFTPNFELFFLPPLHIPITGSFLAFLIFAAGVSGASPGATSSNFRFLEVDGIVESPDGS